MGDQPGVGFGQGTDFSSSSDFGYEGMVLLKGITFVTASNFFLLHARINEITTVSLKIMSLITLREEENFIKFLNEKLCQSAGDFVIEREFPAIWVPFKQVKADTPVAAQVHTVAIHSGDGTAAKKRHFLSLISMPKRSGEIGWLVIDGSPVTPRGHEGEVWQQGIVPESDVDIWKNTALDSLEALVGGFTRYGEKIKVINGMDASKGLIRSLPPLPDGSYVTGCGFWKNFMTRRDPEATGCPHVQAFGTLLSVGRVKDIMEEQKRVWQELGVRYKTAGVESPYKGVPPHVRGVLEQLNVTMAPELEAKRPVLLRGKPQDGKTHTARMFGSREYGKENVFECHFNHATTVDSAIGCYLPMRGRNGQQEICWVDGPIAAAFRNAQNGRKTLLILDEVYRAQSRARNFLINMLTYDKMSNSYYISVDAAVSSGNGYKRETLVASADHLGILATTNAGMNSQVDYGDEAERSRFPVVIDFNVTQEDLFSSIDVLYAEHFFTSNSLTALKSYISGIKDIAKDSADLGEQAIMVPSMRVACSYLDMAYNNAKKTKDHPDNYLGISVKLGIPSLVGSNHTGYADADLMAKVNALYETTLGRLPKQPPAIWPVETISETEPVVSAASLPKPPPRVKAGKIGLTVRPRPTTGPASIPHRVLTPDGNSDPDASRKSII